MPDKFDPYRERLVMETDTVWDGDCIGLDETTRERAALALHESPADASTIAYVRTHTGFCRRITATADDLTRLGIASPAVDRSSRPTEV